MQLTHRLLVSQDKRLLGIKNIPPSVAVVPNTGVSHTAFCMSDVAGSDGSFGPSISPLFPLAEKPSQDRVGQKIVFRFRNSEGKLVH